MNPKRINKQKGKGATYERKLMDLYKVSDAWIKVLNNRRDIKSEYAKYNPKHNDINPILTRTEQINPITNRAQLAKYWDKLNNNEQET